MAKPIIRWMGGKRRLAKTLLSRFPEHSCYVEVFAGGAALYFMREPADVEVVNDINGDLVNLYRVLQHHLEEVVRQFKWVLTSRQAYRWMKDTRPETLTDIQRAARFYYLQQNGFGGKVTSRTFGTATTTPPGLNLMRIEENLSAAHLRLSETFVEQLDWRECMRRYDRPHTLFYLDPPYLDTAGYGVDFPLSAYEEMAALLRTLKGKAIISLNDHPEIRRIFAGFPMEAVPIKYTVGGNGKSVARQELIIYSWQHPSPAG